MVDFNEYLISEVKKYPWLYDMKMEEYKDVAKKEETWKLISSKLYTTPEQCKRRWTTLRDRYRKEMQLARRTNGGTRWSLYGKMSFLLPYVRPGRWILPDLNKLLQEGLNSNNASSEDAQAAGEASSEGVEFQDENSADIDLLSTPDLPLCTVLCECGAQDTEVDQCMQKWRNLRDRYARELRIMRRKSEAAGRKIESSWPLMHRLEFLFNHVKHRSIDSTWCPSDVSNNVQNEDSEPCTESEMSISVSGGVESDLKEIVIPNLPNINAFDDGSQPPNPPINNNNSDGSWLATSQALPMEQNTDFPSPCSSIAGYSGVSVNKKRSLDPPDEQEGSVILCNSPKSRPSGGDDEEHHFGMIVASKLRRLPEKLRDEVEIEILQLLLKVAK